MNKKKLFFVLLLLYSVFELNIYAELIDFNNDFTDSKEVDFFSTNNKNIFIQCGYFQRPPLPNKFDSLVNKISNVNIWLQKTKNGFNRCLLGPFHSTNQAQQALKKIKKLSGFAKTFIAEDKIINNVLSQLNFETSMVNFIQNDSSLWLLVSGSNFRSWSDVSQEKHTPIDALLRINNEFDLTSALPKLLWVFFNKKKVQYENDLDVEEHSWQFKQKRDSYDENTSKNAVYPLENSNLKKVDELLASETYIRTPKEKKNLEHDLYNSDVSYFSFENAYHNRDFYFIQCGEFKFVTPNEEFSKLFKYLDPSQYILVRQNLFGRFKCIIGPIYDYETAQKIVDEIRKYHFFRRAFVQTKKQNKNTLSLLKKEEKKAIFFDQKFWILSQSAYYTSWSDVVEKTHSNIPQLLSINNIHHIYDNLPLKYIWVNLSRNMKYKILNLNSSLEAKKKFKDKMSYDIETLLSGGV